MQSTHLGPFTVWFEHSEEFHSIKREVFSQHAYYVELNTVEPIIIDAGAHIGLATLYFKKTYPKSKIWSIEPIKSNFHLLKKNTEENALEDVTLIRAALTDHGDVLTLHQDVAPLGWNSTASRFSNAWNGQQITRPVEVPAIQLSKLLEEIEQPIDLLKMDIEGSELLVLQEAQHRLHQVKNIILEYHPRADQSYIALEDLLRKSGFSLETWQDGKEINPLKTRKLFTIHATSIVNI